MKIYFSASIRASNPDPVLGMKMVKYLQAQGHKVLSEHVAAANHEEMNEVLLKNTGIDKNSLKGKAVFEFIRKTDTTWVDEAEAMVVLLTGSSSGVGMEIERAILKPERGLPETKILCFVPQDFVSGVSLMISGITEPNFSLIPFSTFDEIKKELEVRLS